MVVVMHNPSPHHSPFVSSLGRPLPSDPDHLHLHHRDSQPPDQGLGERSAVLKTRHSPRLPSLVAEAFLPLPRPPLCTCPGNGDVEFCALTLTHDVWLLVLVTVPVPADGRRVRNIQGAGVASAQVDPTDMMSRFGEPGAPLMMGPGV